MKIHVLPGDAITESFKKTNIKGKIVVCRECFVEGAVEANNLEEFWVKRASFIKDVYGEDEKSYFSDVVREFEKLQNLNAEIEVNLWFEYELFCQVNMWFCLNLLKESKATVYRVAPTVRTEKDIWKGFGKLGEEDLKICYEQKVKFTESDIRLGTNLWNAYQKSDYQKLEKLSLTASVCFPYLVKTCKAEIEKSFYPKKVLKEIMENGVIEFKDIFSEFSRRAGVYGFGDAQVKRLLYGTGFELH